MFTLQSTEKQKLPIRIWLENIEQVDEVCREQARNLSNLTSARHAIALMPDTHQGFGMPIGGVLALSNALIPNAVGVDIGCGVSFMQTSFLVAELTEDQKKKIASQLLTNIPVGFKHHDQPIPSQVIEEVSHTYEKWRNQNKFLAAEWDLASTQLGTLGGGNHFIELGADEEGLLTIMVHSGSRNFGYKVANYYNEKAEHFSKKHGNATAVKKQLASLDVDSEAGRAYLAWMQMALIFAEENRRVMRDQICHVLSSVLPGITFSEFLDVHHNYAAEEEHFGEKLWIHRKGAIHVPQGKRGIIPGAMGSASYIVEGLGNPLSFDSCSHGAGRHLSRKQAEKRYNKEQVLEDLRARGVWLGVPDKSILVDESRFVYKEIDFVMAQQSDLCKPIKRLTSVLVVKG